MHGLLKVRPIQIVLAGFVVSLFLALNLWTSARSPLIWQDEVMFTDPAANLALGQGFTTTAWFQDRSSFFAGNSPLHSLFLSRWMSVFGFDVVAVRGMNYLLIVGVVAASLLALGRVGFVRDWPARLVFALLVFCGDGVTYSYRSGRYDCLGMFVISCLGLAMTAHSARTRAWLLFSLAILVPWCGLQLLPYVALMGLLMLWLRGRNGVLDLVATGAGCVFGVASLLACFVENGVWQEFFKSVKILGGASRTLTDRFGSAATALWIEPSSVLLLGVLMVLLVVAWRNREFCWRSPLGIGLIVGIAVPCLLAFTGKYVRYYAWMAFIPMAASAAAEIQSGRWRPVRPLLVPMLAICCVVGLPARLAVTFREWEIRDPRRIEQVVAAQVRPTDWVYSEYEAYYPAKKTAAMLFLPPYAGLTPEMKGVTPPLSTADRDRINLLILKPSTESQTLQSFPGRWSLVGHYSASPSGNAHAILSGFQAEPYELKFYRRTSPDLASSD